MDVLHQDECVCVSFFCGVFGLCDERETLEPGHLRDSLQYIAGTKEIWNALDISHPGVDVWMKEFDQIWYLHVVISLLTVYVVSHCC